MIASTFEVVLIDVELGQGGGVGNPVDGVVLPVPQLPGTKIFGKCGQKYLAPAWTVSCGRTQRTSWHCPASREPGLGSSRCGSAAYQGWRPHTSSFGIFIIFMTIM